MCRRSMCEPSELRQQRLRRRRLLRHVLHANQRARALGRFNSDRAVDAALRAATRHVCGDANGGDGGGGSGGGWLQR